MAANWKKILFDGADIHVTSITASNLPSTSSNDETLKVLTLGTTNGELRFRQQGQLNQNQGETTGSISGSDGTSIDDFDFSNDKLIFTTSDVNYLNAKIDSSVAGTTKISFKPKQSTFNGTYNVATSPSQLGWISGSGQLNLISGSSIDGFANDINAFTNTYNNALAGNFVGEFLPTATTEFPTTRTYGNFIFDAGGILGNIKALDGAAAHQEKHVSQSGIGSATGNSIWGTDTTFVVGGTEGDENTFVAGGINSVPAEPAQAGRRPGTHTFYWLSASYDGGFADGTRSVSASYSTLTGSVTNVSESIGTLFNSESILTTNTSSMLQDQYTSSVLLGSNLVSAQVNSKDSGDILRDQVTFENNNPQGKQLRLGTPTNVVGLPSTEHDLTIGGTFTADEFDLSAGFTFNEIKISRINGGVNFGTDTTNHHRFHGNTFITGGGVRIEGPVIIEDAPTVQDGFAMVLTLDNGVLKKQALGTTAANTLTGSIAALVNPLSQSFATRINTLRTTVGTDATNDATLIGDLEAGYDTITSSFESGIFFATASSLSNAQSDTIVGKRVRLLKTASFVTDQLTSQTGLTNKILTASFNANRNEVTYLLNSGTFHDVTGIYTGSGTNNTSDITNDVAGLNRYAKRADSNGNLILTQSNTAANILYIADLADNLAGSPNGTHFLTGSGDFSDLSYPDGTFVNDANDSTTQGVIEFGLDADGDGSGLSTYKFGGTGSQMGTDGNPQFTGLTLNGNLTVEGSLTEIRTTNLNIKDQFILVNDGATQGGLSSHDNDKDGGILVDEGGGSGSAFVFDYSAKAWGFRGAGTTDYVDFDFSSELNTPIVPQVFTRTIILDEGFPPASSASLYGDSSANTDRGQMYIDTTAGSENVYIYA